MCYASWRDHFIITLTPLRHHRTIKKLKLQVAARSKAVEVMKNKIAEGCPAIDREEVSPLVLMGVRRVGCRYVDVYVCRYGVHEEWKSVDRFACRSTNSCTRTPSADPNGFDPRL